MELSEDDKKRVLSNFRGHEEHEVLLFTQEGLLYVVLCSCGVKIQYTAQPVEVAIHIKREYWDPTPGVGVRMSGETYRYPGKWVQVHHDYECRFTVPRRCVCDN